MGFSDQLKLKVKKKAHFTCCWCRNPINKVEVHHIIPEAQDGPDIEDNAAPLCGSCHTLLEGNPKLIKELRLRRDHWYEICSKRLEFAELDWPIGSDIPFLDFYQELPPTPGIPAKGIQFTDRDPTGGKGFPVLYLSVYFNPNPSPVYERLYPQSSGRWLQLWADMRFGIFTPKVAPVGTV